MPRWREALALIQDPSGTARKATQQRCLAGVPPGAQADSFRNALDEFRRFSVQE